MSDKKRGETIALLGYSVESMEAATNLGYDFICVVPPGFGELLSKDGVRAVEWEFGTINENSAQLREKLQEMGVRLSIPLYEETVEWAGAINGMLLDNPRLFNRAMLFRDKAMMKRKAQMMGIRVGVFEEVDDRAQLNRFFRRVNEAHTKLPGDEYDPVHVKPISAAGSVGHRMIRVPADVDDVPEDGFPMLAESHLGGQEFSCEAFIHNGRIQFMNINEYIHLGYTQLTPPTPSLEKRRPQIRAAVEKLVKAFDISYGVIHPEYFVDAEGELAFGEVANRVPGGNIFELITRAYGFNAYEALILASDPRVTQAELDAFFPDEVKGCKGHAGNLLVYPKAGFIEHLDLPKGLLEHPYYEKHNLYQPIAHKVVERAGFGNHYGTVFFFGEDPAELKKALEHYEGETFYRAT